MHRLLFCLALGSLLSSCASSDKTTTDEAINYRPVYHYTPEKNWVNDPNGLVYLDGEYHLFYQYNPFGDTWGHMSWGHAVSKDLTTWEELPLALPEYTNADSTETMIFSGSAVVDSLNTSGFFEPGFTKGLVAIYTSHVHDGKDGLLQHQSLAYSSDKGRTWTYHDQNPVLDIGLKDFRDPNVFWYEGKWKMVVAKPLEYLVQIYESPNLKDWKLLSEFGKMGDTAKIWECPSLFPAPVENSDEKKWVMMISSAAENTEFTGMQYFVGDFDGKRFIPQKQEGVFRVDHGKDYYAAIPFNNLPAGQNKPISIGWANSWMYAGALPTEGFRGTFSLARKLSLRNENGLYKLIQEPVTSSSTPTQNIRLTAADLAAGKTLERENNSYHLNLIVDLTGANGFSMALLKNQDESSVLSYDLATKTLSFDRTQSGNVAFHEKFASVDKMIVSPKNNEIELDIFVDNSIIEIYANGGEQVMTQQVFPTKSSGQVIISKK
jgi:fructan beta-fructosidase